MKFDRFICANLAAIHPSASMVISAKAKEMSGAGADIIDLSIGEPDFDTPAHIKDAANEALLANKTHYTHSYGLLELRRAIAAKLEAENGLNVRADEVLVAPGAKQAIFYALAATLNPDDEVLIPEPYWLSYPDIVKLVRGKPIGVPSSEENGFKPDIDAFTKSISPRTKALILNNPNNPSGALWDREELEAVARLADKYDLLIIADEIYEKLLFDDKHFISIGSLPGMAERTVTINGFSKAYAMTGWRVAYMAAPAWLLSEIAKVQQHVATCASSISQYGALAALKGPQTAVAAMVGEYQRRRNLLVSGMGGLSGIHCLKPPATFYALLNVKGLNLPTLEIAAALLDKAGVATVPGSAYGPSGEGYLRLSFATAKEHIAAAVDRIKAAF